MGKNYKYIFGDIYLISNYSIKGFRIISFLSLALISLTHRIQIDKKTKKNTKELTKNPLNFPLVIIQTIFSFDIYASNCFFQYLSFLY
jgi:hypothetical protein